MLRSAGSPAVKLIAARSLAGSCKVAKRHCARPAPPPKAGGSNTTQWPATEKKSWLSGADLGLLPQNTLLWVIPLGAPLVQAKAQLKSEVPLEAAARGQAQDPGSDTKVAKSGSAMAAWAGGSQHKQRGTEQSRQASLMLPRQVCGKACGPYANCHSSAVPAALKEPSEAALNHRQGDQDLTCPPASST